MRLIQTYRTARTFLRALRDLPATLDCIRLELDRIRRAVDDEYRRNRETEEVLADMARSAHIHAHAIRPGDTPDGAPPTDLRAYFNNAENDV